MCKSPRWNVTLRLQKEGRRALSTTSPIIEMVGTSLGVWWLRLRFPMQRV